nr:hypothetical protein [Tanacetum cinerariifolium]
MILNTLDHLGKFDAKGDEGYFIGYSMSSKAFRVFNKRTKRVEENLHVDFLKNKAIKKCTNSTNFLGTKEATGQDVKKDVSSLRYIALPNYGNSNSTVSSLVPSACFDDSPQLSSDLRLISKRVTSQDDTPSLDNILTLINRFEDILRVTTNTDDSNEVEADLGNMENNISASPTPTFKIHKDHPKSQIIGPVDTPIQTRTKSREMEEQRFIATIHQNTNLALLQFCLFLCFLSQEEPKKISDALNDPSWMDVKSAFLYGTIDEEVGTIDQTLFIRRQRGDFILVQVYVDDIIFGSSNLQLCREFEALMHEKFQMSAMGELNFSLVCKFYKRRMAFSLSQDKYGKDGTGKDVDLHLYRSMTGSLMYLTTSKPDIMFAIRACTRHQVTPKECHVHEVKRIFRYLKGHPKLELWYSKESPFDLTIMATSTTEEEYVAATSGCEQVLWIQNQLLDYGHHFIRDCFEKKLISVDYIHTDDNVTDLLTQPFNVGRFKYLVVEHAMKGSVLRNYIIYTAICLSPKSNGFNEFSSNIATALVCLATNKVYNFSKMIFDDELASPIGDDSQGVACTTDSGLEAEHDRANITKTSTLPSKSTPRVTSLAADEGSMQQQLNELTDLVKLLGDREGGGFAKSGEDASIKGMSLDEGEEAAIKRIPTGSGSIPTASPPGTRVPTGGVPTSSDVVLTTSPIFTIATVATPYTRRKGKEKMVESETPKKKKIQEQMDVQMARQLEQDSAKKLKTSEEVPEEKLKEMMQLILVEEHFVREDLNQLWALVKETLNIRPAANDKEKELWLELKRLYEPDVEDQL